MTPSVIQGGGKAHHGFLQRVRCVVGGLRDRDDGLASWLLFLVPLGILIARRIVGATSFGVVLSQYAPIDQVRWAAFSVIVIRELLFGRYDAKTFGMLAMFVAMGVIAYTSDFRSLIDALVFMYGARDLLFEVIARFLFVEISILIFVIFILSGLGVIIDVVYQGDDLRGDRHALGLSHPNSPACYVLVLSLTWSYIRSERFGWIDAIGCSAAMLVIFHFTNSRSALIVLVLFLALALCFKYGPERIRKPRVLLVMGISALVLIAALGIVLCAVFSPDIAWMRRLDSLVSGRLSLGHTALVEYGVAPFGQRVPSGSTTHYDFSKQAWVEGNGRVITDNLYVRLLVMCGPFFLAAALGLVAASIVYFSKRGNWMLVAIAVALLAYALMEAAPSKIVSDPFLLLLAVPFGVRARTASGRDDSR